MRELLLLAVIAGPLAAESISSADRAYLVAHLEMTREFVLDTTRGLTKEQWLFKPAPLRWSIAQCVDHISRTEEYVVQVVRERVLKSEEPLLGLYPSRSAGLAATPEKPHRMSPSDDAIILRWMTDRAPAVARPVEQRPPVEEIAPRSSFDNPLSALDHFLKVRAATLDYVKATKDDLRGNFTLAPKRGFPAVKFEDAYQSILRMSAHTERHLIQIHEVKAAEGYPH